MTCRHHDEDEQCADCTPAPPKERKTVPELIAEIREQHLAPKGKS